MEGAGEVNDDERLVLRVKRDELTERVWDPFECPDHGSVLAEGHDLLQYDPDTVSETQLAEIEADCIKNCGSL